MNTAPLREREVSAFRAAADTIARAGSGVRLADAPDGALERGPTSGALPRTPVAPLPWWRGLWRVARYAAIGMGLLTALPLATIGVNRLGFLLESSRFGERVLQVEALRALRVPTNSAVTPAAAGDAFARLFPVDARDGYVPRRVIPKNERPAQRLAAIVSPANTNGDGAPWWGPKHEQIIGRAAAGLSTQERDVLRRIADAPLWPIVDLVASAPSVDVVGGSFRTPFADGVQAYAMPIVSHHDARTVLYASISRAAHFVSLREYAQAELALRRALSIGFVLIDNGASPFDAMMGRMVVGGAYKGLQELAQIPQAKGRLMPLPALPDNAPRGPRETRFAGASFDALRETQLRNVADASLPRTLRLASLEDLQWSTCGSLTEAVLGPSAEVLAANTTAVASLGRTPAEREHVRLITRPRTFEASRLHGSPLAQAAAGAAQIVSAVTGNPHFAACTRVALDMR
ncbi:hypothetical protein [Gemmatimonas sp.]|uniref:hypothetical protein n=1 Tax=Gemmatimonas sp. TaxID=1962908 RepID=UPI003F720FDE